MVKRRYTPFGHLPIEDVVVFNNVKDIDYKLHERHYHVTFGRVCLLLDDGRILMFLSHSFRNLLKVLPSLYPEKLSNVRNLVTNFPHYKEALYTAIRERGLLAGISRLEDNIYVIRKFRFLSPVIPQHELFSRVEKVLKSYFRRSKAGALRRFYYTYLFDNLCCKYPLFRHVIKELNDEVTSGVLVANTSKYTVPIVIAYYLERKDGVFLPYKRLRYVSMNYSKRKVLKDIERKINSLVKVVPRAEENVEKFLEFLMDDLDPSLLAYVKDAFSPYYMPRRYFAMFNRLLEKYIGIFGHKRYAIFCALCELFRMCSGKWQMTCLLTTITRKLWKMGVGEE